MIPPLSECGVVADSCVCGRELHRFNEFVKNDPRVEHVLLPAFDGLNFIRVRNAPN